MARVTVEDCVDKVPNRFDLVVAAAMRAKQIAAGAPLTLDRDNDKDAVVALREIAEETVNVEELSEEVINGFCRRQLKDEFVAAPYADEIEDELAAQAQEVMEEESKLIASDSAEAETAPDGMSFDDENIEIED